MRTKITVILRDVCSPDFLQNHRGELITIPFNYPSDVDDIQDELVTELKSRYDLKDVDMLSVADCAMDILGQFAHVWNAHPDFTDQEKDQAYSDINAYVALIH